MSILADPASPAKQNPGQTAHTVQATVRPVPTIEHVVAAPLDQLLAEQNARVAFLDLGMDIEFYGHLVCRGDGPITIAMPPGRDSLEREITIRMLLAQFHDLDTAGFPDHMTATTTIRNGKWVL
ncbi:hypothetical protein ACH4Q7_14685 [Streptomyces roseolus]|uniref:hypothetical protein n=1 Tax=Streptomyces roseolus TaxID=67358 RepID=UPI003792141B